MSLTPVNLLALDGGGVRGISEIRILQIIMDRLKARLGLPDGAHDPLPCDWFQLIGGTSTGGLIAIMLSRLRMTAVEAAEQYNSLAKEIFGPKNKKSWVQDGTFKATTLQKAVEGLVEWRNRAGDTGTKMIPNGYNNAADAKCFVCALEASNMRFPEIFRSYPAIGRDPIKCEIWEAARAISAAPTFFKEIKINIEGGTTLRFVDGGLKCNNPVGVVMDEAEKVFGGDQSVGCIVSLGSGLKSATGVKSPTGYQKILPIGLLKALGDIATDSQSIADTTAKRFGPKSDVYYRFNATNIGDLSLAEWDSTDGIVSHTRSYCGDPEISDKIDQVVDILFASRVQGGQRESTWLKLGEILNVPREPKRDEPSVYGDSQSKAEFEKIALQLEDIQSEKIRVEKMRILKWLSSYDFSASHLSATKSREPATGLWMLRSPQYQDWKQSEHGLLWLYGKSGCGKSYLCSTIIDDLQSVQGPSYVLAYWYFSFSDAKSRNIEELLCSVIRQLCAGAHTLPYQLNKLSEEYDTAGSRPPLPILKNTLDSVVLSIKNDEQDVFIVLDGLDECPRIAEQIGSSGQQSSERKDILQWLKKFCRDHSNARTLVLSRDESDIRRSIGETTQIDVEEGAVDDLHLFMENCINRIVEEQDWKDKYRDRMSSKLVGAHEKRFRWASLVQKRFSECLAPKKMEEALNDLPKSLEAMYADVLMKKIPEEYREEAKVMLMWLAYSYRPLTLSELAVVASIPEQNVLHICTSSLVSLDEDVVKFDHFSVKEFLVSERYLASNAPTASSFYIPPMLAHLQIAGTCISTLLDPKLVDLIKRYLHPDFHHEWRKLMTYQDEIYTIIPLLPYSLDWHLHVQDADSMTSRLPGLNDPSLMSESESLRDHIHKLFCDENYLSFTYSTRFKIPHETDLSLTPLHYATYLNLPDSVRRLLKARSNPREAMSVASSVASAMSNEPQKHKTPLHIAGIMGNLEIVSLLLDSGMRIAQSDFEHMIGNNRSDGTAVVTSILKAQLDLSITDDAIRAAASNDRTTEFIKYFLHNGFLSSKARLLLVFSHWSQRNQGANANTGLFKVLVKKGDDIGCTSQDFFNAVSQGSFFRGAHETLLKFVLERYEPLSLSQPITECITSGTAGAVEMLRFLCQKYKVISFGQDQLAAAAKHIRAMDLVDIILDYDKTLNISQRVIQAAARNRFSNKVLFAMMYHNKGLEITWKVLKSISNIDSLKVLMDHEDCGFIPNEGFIFPNEEPLVADAFLLMGFHIDSYGDCKVAVSEQMLQAAARWEPDAIDYLQSRARPNVTFRKYALEESSILRGSNTI